MRLHYSEFKPHVIKTVLSQRTKAVLVSGVRVIKTWFAKYNRVRKRPAAASKRPAADVLKRPAASDVSSRPAKESRVSEPEEAAPVSQAGSPALIALEGCDEIEAACGDRYRREVSALGFGISQREMVQVLFVWGFEVTREACANWLRRYRLQSAAKDGCNALYRLSLHDLQYWYHVEKLSPTELQQRYLEVCGVYAHRANLVAFLKAPAQQLPHLENNQCIHSHACGEYALQELQRGRPAEEVREGLLQRYLVTTTVQRLHAYRNYREQMSEYWTQEKLERLHWERLYGTVSLDVSFVSKHRHLYKSLEKLYLETRTVFCLGVSIAEELIPLAALRDFYRRHEEYVLFLFCFCCLELHVVCPIHLMSSALELFRVPSRMSYISDGHLVF